MKKGWKQLIPGKKVSKISEIPTVPGEKAKSNFAPMITERPEGMDYELYRKLRKLERAYLKQYLKGRRPDSKPKTE